MSASSSSSSSLSATSSNRQVCESCFHFLNIEMVRYVVENEERKHRIIVNRQNKLYEKDGGALATCQEDFDHRGELMRKEEVILTLHRLGFGVGIRLVERMTRDKPLFSETLEVVKFICKDFSQFVFKKHFDNLRTDHRGTFALHDNRCLWLTRLSAFSPEEQKEKIPLYQSFFCGLLEGAFSNLGHSCNVTAVTTQIPLCTFKIVMESIN